MAFLGVTTPQPVYQPLPIIWVGTLEVAVGNIYLPTDATYQITAVRAAIGTPSVGAPVIADILANGQTIYPTNPQSRPSIPAGAYQSIVTVPDIATLSTNTLISMNIVQVGSTTPGANLTVVMSMERIGS